MPHDNGPGKSAPECQRVLDEAHEAAVALRWQEIDAGAIGHKADIVNRQTQALKAEHEKRINALIGSPRSVHAKIEAIWQAVDEIAALAKPHAACRRGCSHCCHIPVLIPQQEAELIGKRIGVKPRKVVGITRREDIESGYHNPCPFLREDQCSIYEHRPLACRAQLNMDRDALLCELVGKTARVPYLNLHGYNEAMVMVTSQREEVIGRDPATGFMRPGVRTVPPDVGDIREFFPHGKR